MAYDLSHKKLPTAIQLLPRLLGVENRLVQAAALERGGLLIGRGKVNPQVLTISNGTKSHLFYKGWCDKTPRPVATMARNKQATKAILMGAGIAVTRGELFHASQENESSEYARSLGFPVVVKPNNGLKGSQVHANLQSDEEFDAAFRSAGADFKFILVEKHFQAEEYRFTLVNDRVVGVVRRVPAHVIGDGESTIDQLVEQKNVARRANAVHPPIKLDSEVGRLLKRGGLSSESVPEVGLHVQLRNNSNVSTGGEAIDVTDDIDPYYREQVQMASKAFRGLYVGGFDVMIKDSTKEGGEYTIIEVNHDPMFSLHHYPWQGEARNIAKEIVNGLF